MKILRNKYFILGNIALLLAAIPLTLLFISRQQDIRSRAAPTTRITFAPTAVSFEGGQCSPQIVTVRLDPGENIVSTVELFLTYDATKFGISIAVNKNVFPDPNGILRGPTIQSGQASVIMDVGFNVENLIQAPVDIATITITPIAATTGGAVNLTIDNSKTRVLSQGAGDGDTENVFMSGGQSAISINAACLTGGTGGSPTATPTVSIAPTLSISPTQGANQAPVCSTLTASPSASGSAPFALTLTAKGSDTGGTITKATFNFGNNTVQDVTVGLGTAAVTTELSHTYQTAGVYSASVIFTDNSGALSSSCVAQITVNASSQASPTPTTGGIAPTATPTPTPTIENPGGLGTTVAIIGGLLLVILGGLALIVL